MVQQARERLQAKRDPLLQALDEPLSERHRLLLQEIRDHLGFLEPQMQRLEEQLLAGMAPYQRYWQLLQTIPGIDAIGAAEVRQVAA